MENSFRVAVIGMSGRFPGCKNIQEFWQKLVGATNCISHFSAEDLLAEGVSLETLEQTNYVRAAPILDDIDLLDAEFFGITPREAELIDPQQRLFLECCWEAIEDAGYDPTRLTEPTGVFGGARTNTYALNLLAAEGLVEKVGAFHLGLLNDLSSLTTRVSHCLNLTGPSCAIHTACSTSLVAVHLACQSLLNMECHIAIAGGVAINIPHIIGYTYEEGSVQSPDGHCRTFDADARGTVFGSGVGVVVLKRFEDAVKDGDFIHAVILGSAINNDGAGTAGFAAPSARGQSEVIRDALRYSGAAPDTITYIECHGTGTLVGDAIEIRALKKAFGKGTAGRCALGSVKTNVGHLDAASGVTGLIKTILSLKHKKLPPVLHFKKLNSQIDLSDSPFYINTQLSEWKQDCGVLRAGVSAFGVGGTNAHVILEEAPTLIATDYGNDWHLIVLSARTKAALSEMSYKLAAHLQKATNEELADVAYTLQVGRQRFAHRRSVVGRSFDEVIEALERHESLTIDELDTSECSTAQVVFLFPGQGTELLNAGRELYRKEAIFRRSVDRCSEVLRSKLGVEINELIRDDGTPGQWALKSQARISQPLLLSLEYSLAQLWTSLGVSPQAMVGHSLGEYTAACLAGVMTLEEALNIIAIRGQLMENIPPGAMLAVSIAKEEAELLLGPNMAIAAINAPDLCTVSGPIEEVLAVENKLRDRGVACRKLNTSHAFHSSMVAPVVDQFREEVRKLHLRAPQIPFISTVTGSWIENDEARNPGYWATQMLAPVQFDAALRHLIHDPGCVLLEVGPGQTLQRLAQRQRMLSKRRVLASLPADSANSEYQSIMASLGLLWEAGATINWDKVHQGQRRRRIPLPTYPFQRRRFWIEKRQAMHRLETFDVKRILIEKPDSGTIYWTPSWREAGIAPSHSKARPTASYCIIFMDDKGIGRSICSLLVSKEQEFMRVYRGTEFRIVAPNTFEVNPTEPSGYRQVFESIGDGRQIGFDVIYLWGIGSSENGTDSLPRSVAPKFCSALFLAHALLACRADAGRSHVIIVGTHITKVEQPDTQQADSAALLAFARVIPHEHPRIIYQTVDIAPPASTSDCSRCAAQILRELDAEANDQLVAYRGERRWVPVITPAIVGQEVQGGRGFMERGRYVIFGGLGDVGLQIAARLAELADVHLTLVSRTALPSRSQWSALLARGTETRESARVEAILAMESRGAVIDILAADIGDRQQMWRLIDRFSRDGRQIDGVIHAVGVTTGPSVLSPVVRTTTDHIDTQIGSKLRGLQLISEFVEAVSPEFILIISSNVTVVGGIGSLAYAAGNLVTDAFCTAHDGRNTRTRWICSNWDHWPESRKRGIGKELEDFYRTFDQAQVISALKEKHSYALSSIEAQDAVVRVVAAFRAGQVLVSKRRFGLIDNREGGVNIRGTEVHGQDERLGPRPAIRTPYVGPRTEGEMKLAAIWGELLGIDRVGINDDFFELGGHSLLATQLIGEVRVVLGAEIPLGKLFEGPTIAAMASLLMVPEVSKIIGD